MFVTYKDCYINADHISFMRIYKNIHTHEYHAVLDFLATSNQVEYPFKTKEEDSRCTRKSRVSIIQDQGGT